MVAGMMGVTEEMLPVERANLLYKKGAIIMKLLARVTVFLCLQLGKIVR